MFDEAVYQKERQCIFSEYRTKYALRNSDLITDGVVDLTYYGITGNKRVLLLLKEAYGQTCQKGEWNLAEELKNHNPWGMWHRVGEWLCGISETDKARIAPYRHFSVAKKAEAIRRAAVINVKKVNGKSSSDGDDLMEHTISNTALLRRQIESVQPEIIICGNTYSYLQKIFGLQHERDCDNWYYWLDLGEQKNVLVLDYYHPADRGSSLLAYYGITNIYQQALLNRLECGYK